MLKIRTFKCHVSLSVHDPKRTHFGMRSIEERERNSDKCSVFDIKQKRNEDTFWEPTTLSTETIYWTYC